MRLPEEFLRRMQALLGRDFKSFLEAYESPPRKGIRLNPLKADFAAVCAAFEGNLEKTSFSPLSFYINREKVGDMPLHAAGAFYAQEPSAASAVTVLDPKPGEKILDLCAAPGGKSTQIAALLEGRGLLWSNEIVRSRANILLSNFERMGVRNGVVSSCHPDRLCESLAGFFDRVLVDAPCSGEGMFRKNPEAIAEWSPEHVLACSDRQLAILNSAAHCVREGGTLVYSTCTFSQEENEGVCLRFLKENPAFQLVSPNVSFGRKAMGIDGVRILPMDGGEGHFVAKFLRTGPNHRAPVLFRYPQSTADALGAGQFYQEHFKGDCFGPIMQLKEKFLILPLLLPEMKGLSVLRAGVELGEQKNGRIEPSHGLFTCQKAESCKQVIELDGEERLRKFLHGEEIPCETKGFTAVAVLGAVAGFGKASNGMLKNRYPKGLRLR